MNLVGRHHEPSQEDVDGRQGTTGKLGSKAESLKLSKNLIQSKNHMMSEDV